MSNAPQTSMPRVLQTANYLAVRSLIAAASIPSFPIARNWARQIGKWYGLSRMNRRHMERSIDNLRTAFPSWDEQRIHDVAVASHQHLTTFGIELAYMPRLLTDDGWVNHMSFGTIEPALRALVEAGPCILITGHCGNWESLGYSMALMGFPIHAVYRPLDLPSMDRWVRRTRSRRGLELVDKFGAVRQLPLLLRAGAPIGLVADQNGGDRGVFVPFFNRLTSTYKSIGLLALQFNATIICGVAHRVDVVGPGLGHRIDMHDIFGPKDWSTHPDPLFYLTARYRRAIEKMIAAAPEQYLWMHRIWRSRPRHERLEKPFPDALRENLRLLPWMTDADLEQIKEHSVRDTATLKSSGKHRLG